MAGTLRVLVVVTSHDRLGETGRATGFYFEELATPYWAFVDAGLSVDIASIAGGRAPADPASLETEGTRPASVQRFLDDPEAMAKIEATLPVAAVDPDAYGAVFLPGGHGTMWDFPASEALARVIATAWRNGAVVGAVCHGPSGLVAVRREDGEPLVAGQKVNAFTNAEEEAVGLAAVVPFLLESRLRELGGRFEAAPDFEALAVRDGRLVTGQNPRSSGLVAAEILMALEQASGLAA